MYFIFGVSFSAPRLFKWVGGHLRFHVQLSVECNTKEQQQQIGLISMATKIISGTRFSSLPASYIRGESDRPNLSQVDVLDNIPLIDLSCEDRSLVIDQIGRACRDYGFFQVINHGVSKEAVNRILATSHEFFGLSVEDKMKLYSDDPSRTMRLSSSFNVSKETVHNWRDYLRLHCYPLDRYVPEWPTAPSSFKEVVSGYCREIRELGLRLEEAISESLGLEKECLKKILGGEEQGQHMALNYYPACPEPELTYGLPAHTDPNAVTILLQDMEVAGLQILNGGKWLAVKPHPDAFVINIGDQIQAVSNGKYKSVWHRAVVNAHKPRLSVASFLVPSDAARIRAPAALGGNTYKDFTYAEYYKTFWSRDLDQKHCLEFFKN
ncbi:protein DOWNY MILDEW RESISTANCE 6-like isoform X2 [Salvia miltiorrhiza]|uniref:protein DOWNY MILDEW RESISTANCE 6-like isoform X2 n=1 Tax=Salvia miltiorrhiza TaxID=226208 RepID=UPI0025ABFADE|nr:protein DOWNY MILDEW RESISTANCE 6-like isoform X2 [Salvia miltiorrhiza]